MAGNVLHRWLRLCAACAALALIGASDDRPPVGQLTISTTRDGDATIVEVTGPQALLDRSAAFLRYQTARNKACSDLVPFQVSGVWIGWGDERGPGTYVSTLPEVAPGCLDGLRHVYRAPGEYQIKASLYHLGPSDAPVSEWDGTASVTIAGKAPPLELSVIRPARDSAILFQQRVPVRWKLSTPKPIDLLMEIVTQDGLVLGSWYLLDLRYAGEGETEVMIGGDMRINLSAMRKGEDDIIVAGQAAYWQHLRNETVPVVARIHVREQGRDLLVKDSEPFRVTAQIDTSPRGYHRARVELMPDAANTVRLQHLPFTAHCHSYKIDWGDGSSPDISLAPAEAVASRQCSGPAKEIESRHTYERAGSYQIVLRTDEYGEADRSLDNASYQVLSVTAP